MRKTWEQAGKNAGYCGKSGPLGEFGACGKRDSRELTGGHNDWCRCACGSLPWQPVELLAGSCSHWRKLAPREAKVCPIWYSLLIPHWQAVTKLDTNVPLLVLERRRIILAAGLDLR